MQWVCWETKLAVDQREHLLQSGQPGRREPESRWAKAGTGLSPPSPALCPASQLPTPSVYKLRTLSVHAAAPPGFSTLSWGPFPASPPHPTSGDLVEPGGPDSRGWNGQVSPERWGGAGGARAPPQDPVTPGLEFDTGQRRA